MTTQDPELSAALGWPGGISNPVLDRTRLLQIVAALRLTSKQVLELLYRAREHFSVYTEGDWFQLERDCQSAITALRAALAESGRDWSLLEATQESLREHMAEIHRLRAALAQQDEPVQMHPSQFAELIKGKEAMIGVPVYWSEWPTKETQ